MKVRAHVCENCDLKFLVLVYSKKGEFVKKCPVCKKLKLTKLDESWKVKLWE